MTAVDRRRVGTTALYLPEIGFGAASLGNLYRVIDDATAHATLDAALAAGITYVDTAPQYGRGLSERRVGDAVRSRRHVIVSTKVGRLLEPDASIVDDRLHEGFRSPMPFSARYDYSHDGVLRSVEDSLQRLGLARIDLLYVHDIGRRTHGEAHALYWEQLTRGGGLRALERLRDEGAVAGFGVGVNEVEVCLEVMRETRLDAILLAGRYTLLEQGALDALFPACSAAGTSIVIGGPYNSGVLATGTRTTDIVHYDYAPAPPAIVARVRAIEAVADRHAVALPAAALQFVLAHPQVSSVIPGCDSAARVGQTIDLYRHAIPAAFWTELRADGLVRADAPLPGDPA
ncbi:pyridoxal 4-dehydrogenase [Sphingomonas sp. Leaf67]|uniref:aldo/keto reductase n=1 Tax=Sphingomonas sp. Leaf67 TaxID=1736230 RepID=UPI0006FE0316|nr:aldo/keto reductase [Sphingomonas sp. Leaf67]KQN90734.1 pyridoxal 4-dehydrogenase [Sphingomonas sp. Leaf67]